MNEDLKNYARINKIYLWEIADEMGLADHSLSRKLRHKFNDSDHATFIAAVDKLVADRNEGC